MLTRLFFTLTLVLGISPTVFGAEAEIDLSQSQCLAYSAGEILKNESADLHFIRDQLGHPTKLVNLDNEDRYFLTRFEIVQGREFYQFAREESEDYYLNIEVEPLLNGGCQSLQYVFWSEYED